MRLKIIVERQADGYVAYPLGIQGVVVGQGATVEAALVDARSAVAFHVETFGPGRARHRGRAGPGGIRRGD